MVFFSPIEGHYAVDIYFRGGREFCGRGHKTPAEAMKEGTDWLNSLSEGWLNGILVPA
jgi:hypothetical protein